ARVGRLVHRVAEAGDLRACGEQLSGRLLGAVPGLAELLEQVRALLGGAEHDRSGAEDARGDRALQRARVGRERHPGGDARRHHPVLGDRDQQQVEEEALLRRRLLAGQQEMDVLREGQAAHQVACQVAATHLDTVRVGPRDPRDRVGHATRAGSRSGGGTATGAPSWGGSMVMFGSSRSSQRGMYHVFSRSSVKNAGTSDMRTISASVRIATASRSPNSFGMRSALRMNAENTVPMMIAAATTTRPMAAMPCWTASFVWSPWTCSSRMRLMMKTM